MMLKTCLAAPSGSCLGLAIGVLSVSSGHGDSADGVYIGGVDTIPYGGLTGVLCEGKCDEGASFCEAD